MGRGRGAVASVAMMLSLSACDVTVGNAQRDAREEAVLELFDGGRTLHLTFAMTRTELAVPEGWGFRVIQHPDDEPFDVEFRFPAYEVIDPVPADRDDSVDPQPRVLDVLDAELVGVRTDTSHFPRGKGPVRAFYVKVPDLTLGRLNALLDDAVARWGADPSDVDDFMRQAYRTEGGQADLSLSIPTATRWPVTLTLEPRVTALEGYATLTYLLEWPTHGKALIGPPSDRAGR